MACVDGGKIKCGGSVIIISEAEIGCLIDW